MVTLGDFKRYLDRNTGTELAQMGPEVASAMVDQYLEEVILSEYAAGHGVEIPAEKIASAVRNDAGVTVIEKRDEMRRQKLIGDMSENVPMPADTDIRAYYDQHPGEFKSGEEVHVKQILVHEESVAGDIEQKLHAGASFEELSGQYSLAPNAKKGGEIGYVSRGELPKMFEDEIFALKPGSVSGVIRTDASFHIFKVEDRRKPSANGSGSGCSTVSDAPAIYSASFSTGAIDISNNLAGFSSRGPSTFYTPNLLKPNISAPGVNVRSSHTHQRQQLWQHERHLDGRAARRRAWWRCSGRRARRWCATSPPPRQSCRTRPIRR